MGLLAENKIRRKINKDPNNTKWTRDTNTFGQKILRAQGWQPGQFLGAENAPHSELHTAANASYIRVVLKDDMKGLGFSRAKEDEVTGLDVFQDLLSRLNGKTEDQVVEDQQARLAVKTHHFVEQRYGPMRFVYGGLLVGDEMKEKDDEEAKTPKDEDEDVVMESTPAPKESKKEKKSKKRKASEDDEDSSSRESDSKSKKRRKEERKLKENDSSADTDDAKAKKKDKKSKKDKSRKKSAEVSEEESEERSKKRKSKSKDKSRSPEDSEEDKVKDKKSKKEKKEKKDKKRKKEEAAASESSSTVATQESTPVPSIPGTGVTTPSGTSTPRGSRNFVRSRFIAQKRQAVLDTKALNQIFMVKA
ncbi:telomerase inhibitor [Fusarium falciforme]|uniref:PinX1-related protein 1 n=1 Tax=Fusarium falciforme TaxID=195108 RepID=A0A9W8V7J8_9HYPO|nr:telomerase inhibitor [Fusarium falciforme]KAJ4196666.1 telomerase inhibitor [Fusarium falciforme]KAJ4259070.1 telomerase inhibitor [Fusarium falciforme]